VFHLTSHITERIANTNTYTLKLKTNQIMQTPDINMHVHLYLT